MKNDWHSASWHDPRMTVFWLPKQCIDWTITMDSSLFLSIFLSLFACLFLQTSGVCCCGEAFTPPFACLCRLARCSYILVGDTGWHSFLFLPNPLLSLGWHVFHDVRLEKGFQSTIYIIWTVCRLLWAFVGFVSWLHSIRYIWTKWDIATTRLTEIVLSRVVHAHFVQRTSRHTTRFQTCTLTDTHWSSFALSLDSVGDKGGNLFTYLLGVRFVFVLLWSLLFIPCLSSSDVSLF